MASSKYKGLVWKRKGLDMVVSCLRKENACLKKALVELSRQHSEHLKLVESFISLQTVRMENSQQPMDEDNETASPSALSIKGQNLMDGVTKDRVSAYAREMEETKNKLVSLSARCQYLENKVKGEKDEQGSNCTQTELENHLRDALEKNKHLLEYDQQREACVRAVMARMLWLERQLNEANQARSNQDNEDHSDVKKKMCQMQEFYERLLQKAKEELDVLREQLNFSKHSLKTAHKWCEERELEVEELKQQLHDRCSEYEVKRLTEKTKDLERRLHKEKRSTETLELQIKILQEYLLNSHRGDQENSRTDLEPKTSSPKPTSTSRSVMNETFLTCPVCLAEYPASHYQDLMRHMEFCLD